jgi:PqqD family protein of HPr-rel-A system
LRQGPALARSVLADTSVVFDPTSGETFFLNELPALLLENLDDKPVSMRALVGRIAQDLIVDVQAEQRILAALAFLEKADLIVAVEGTGARPGPRAE